MAKQEDETMPIWPQLFLMFALCVDTFVVYHNWGWWREGVRFSFDGFWESLLPGIFSGVILCGIFTAACVGAGYSIAAAIGSEAAIVWQPGWHARLASLRNADSTYGSLSGGILLVSGHIGPTEVYYYYEDCGGGVYKPHKWRVNDDVTVIEEDRTDGTAQQFYTEFADKGLHRWATHHTEWRIEFRIPKGSLVHQFSLK